MRRVVIISPSNMSLYTLSVLALAPTYELEVVGVLVRRLLSADRIRREWRRDGKRLVRKVIQKIVFKERKIRSVGGRTLRDVAEELQVASTTVADYCEVKSIPIRFAGNLNESSIVDEVRSWSPEMILFTGGGLIRRRLLEVAPLGILNCHAGILPRYRGMDVVEWAALEGAADQMGQTVHLMDRGVDTGPILRRYPTEVRDADTFRRYRARLLASAPQRLVETASDYADGDLEPMMQSIDEGRQYFRIHSRLKAIAAANLEAMANTGGFENIPNSSVGDDVSDVKAS